jgi:hypothetical protein
LKNSFSECLILESVGMTNPPMNLNLSSSHFLAKSNLVPSSLKGVKSTVGIVLGDKL